MRTNRSLLLIALTALSVSWPGHAADPAPVNTALGLAVSPAGQGAIIRLKTRVPILDYTSYDADASTVVVDIPDLEMGSLPAHFAGNGVLTGVDVEKPVISAPPGSPQGENGRFENERSFLRVTLHRTGNSDIRITPRGEELAISIGPKGSMPDTTHDKAGGSAQQQEGTIHQQVNVERVDNVHLGTEDNKTYTAKVPIREIPVPAHVAEPATVTSTASTPAEAHAIEPVAVAAKPALKPQGRPASVLNNIRWAPDGLHLDANGALNPKITVIDNPPRLAIDLAGVIEHSRVRQIPVANSDVKAVRVGQFSPAPDAVARVVLDLNKSVQYDVIFSAKGALIRINPDTAIRANAAPAADMQPAAMAELPPPTPAIENALQAASAAPLENSGTLSVLPVGSRVPPKDNSGVIIKDIDARITEGLLSNKQNLHEAADSSAALPAGGGAGRPNKDAHTLVDENQKFSGKPISFVFKDADVLDVIRYFHEISGLNFIVHPAVKGLVTVDLVNLPWDQAMDIILRNLGLDYIYSNNVIWIAPQSEIIAQQKQFLANQALKQQTEKPITEVIRISYPKAADLAKILDKNKSDRGSYVVDDRTNMLILSEIPSYMAKIRKLIRVLDIPAPQVRIEARIVEANASFSETFGINLGGRWLRAGQAPGPFKPLSGTGTPFGGMGGGTLPDGGWNTTGQFGSINPATAVTGFVEAIIANTSGAFALDVQIAAQEKRGRGRVLSSPSISVEDNSTATIKAGQEIAITTCGGNSCTVTTKEGVLSLNITPQITADGNVAMNIDLINDKLDLANISLAGSSSSIPLFRRSAKTRLKVRDGDTAVIGGVSITSESIGQTGVPILSHIPILGWLFKNRTRQRDNTEILIFITPKILR